MRKFSPHPFAAQFIRGVEASKQPELIKAATKLHAAIHELVKLETNSELSEKTFERAWKRAVENVEHWVLELGHLQCARGALVHAGTKPVEGVR